MSATEYVSTAVTALVVTAAALLVDFVATRRGSRRPSKSRPGGWLTRCAYAVVLFSVCVLAATALYGMAAQGHVRRWTLLAHIVAAGILLPALTIVAVGWSRRTVTPLPQWDTGPATCARLSTRWHWSFWSVLLAAVITAGTMLVSMMPILDTRGLTLMLTIHAYSGLMLLVAVIIHAYCLLTAKWGWP